MENVTRFETLTRIGFAARGLTYVIVGFLALSAGRAADTADALRTMADSMLGRIALGVVAVGLLAYGAWRIIEAGFDLEGHGRDAKGAVVRVGHGLSGILHLLLGLLALGLATGMASQNGGGQETQAATSWVLGLPGGELLVRLIGVGLMAAGAFQIVQAIQLKFLRQLDARAEEQAWVKWAGRLGYLARGVVFVIIGIFFWRAGETANAQQAGGMAEALASLPGWSQALVAAGLILFGLFSMVQAIYRRITDTHVVERLRARMA